MKYVEIGFHLVHDIISSNYIQVQFIASNKQIDYVLYVSDDQIDAHTKPLLSSQLIFLQFKLNIIPYPFNFSREY